MRPGRTARRFLHVIDRYRTSPEFARYHGACRFRPTCSAYAARALRTRALPYAVVLIVWRLLRCTRLTRAGTFDPVPIRRTSLLQVLRRRGRTVVTGALGLISVTGLVVLLTAAPAEAVGITKGCSATVNGVSPAQMTHTDPLVVHKGEQVVVRGTGTWSGVVVTRVRVDLIGDLAQYTGPPHQGTGRSWGGTVNVDEYLKYGSGLYLVRAYAVGDEWSCTASGYVRLSDGSPLTKPIGAGAAGLAVAGAAGVAGASLAGTRQGADEGTPEPQTGDEKVASDVSDVVTALSTPAEPPAKQMRDVAQNAVKDVGCLFFVIAVFLALLSFIDFDRDAGSLGAATTTSALGAAKQGRVTRHGHPVLGAVSGLVFGLGAAVLLQQFAVWPLTLSTAIVVPLVCALAGGVRAYLGTTYRTAPR
jgi:putative component of membrane protein insertase Oxa1/YidC/SpoIIIJ protein YidD